MVGVNLSVIVSVLIDRFWLLRYCYAHYKVSPSIWYSDISMFASITFEKLNYLLIFFIVLVYPLYFFSEMNKKKFKWKKFSVKCLTKTNFFSGKTLRFKHQGVCKRTECILGLFVNTQIKTTDSIYRTA